MEDQEQTEQVRGNFADAGVPTDDSDSGMDGEPRAGPSASKHRNPSNAHNRIPKTLGKGRACVKCRSRKTRCDGKQPSCSTCLRLKRECVYTEKKPRRRAPVKVANESIPQNLDNGGRSAHPTTTSDDRGRGELENSESTIVASPLLHESVDGPVDLAAGEWWIQDPPPRPIQRYLLNICIEERTRFSLYIHVGRFWESMSPLYKGPRPTPGFLNAMYLIACNVSLNPVLLALEPKYLARTRAFQAEALANQSTDMIQWLQASCLIVFYLCRTSRFLEARQELAGAIHIMRLCGLHKIKSSDWNTQEPLPHNCLISPAKDNIELGERICVFWMAYQFDHMCSLISGLPPDHYFEAETETVWPRSIEEYEHGLWTTPDASVASLFEPEPAHPFDPPCMMYALRCKAVALLTRVAVFATSCSPAYIRTSEFNERFRYYQEMVGAFMERLPPNTYDPSTMEIEVFPTPQVNVSVILAHRIAMGTFIQLYNIMGLTSKSSGPFYDRRLTMAKRSMQLMIAFIKSKIALKSTPIACAYLWFSEARVIAQHVRKLQTHGTNTPADAIELEELQAALQALFNAMIPVRHLLPVISLQIQRLQDFLDGGQEEDLATHVGSSSF
ncbi:hypothetical protein FRB94_012428 [Tulasnella sp. JGI-2019a]|nr:hypothetical protein FRB94_012428 [Tulasnella sp. JGI-2019a]KAG9007260.1 hypothetical protein FRB93_008083 [Tulasnella sp. JGI-2019a]KAG9033568.1 hypothetical protein FRB95_014646 [Tulasnella sp. JGI-2019a]